MGGWNSGPWGGRPTVEGCGSLILDVNKLVRLARPAVDGRAVVGACMSGELRGRPFRIELRASLFPSDETWWCRISHPSIQHLSCETGPQDYTVGPRGHPLPVRRTALVVHLPENRAECRQALLAERGKSVCQPGGVLAGLRLTAARPD
jgi:hypothetical protein